LFKDIFISTLLSDKIILKQGSICVDVFKLNVKVIVAGQLFSPVSSTNKTDRHDITEILLKVALDTIALTLTLKKNNDGDIFKSS
jgi:hypothetical protein